VFGLRGVDGSTHTVEVQPQPDSAMPAVAGPASRRSSGSLADLGAPTLHYIHLDASVLGGIPGFPQALTAAEGATGLVLDMRGYPSGNHYQMAQRLIPPPFTPPLFRIPFRAGPDRFDRVERFYDLEPLGGAHGQEPRRGT